MLMRTDPFRELDRVSQRLLGDNAAALAMPMDAYRDDDAFVIALDVPGADAESIDLEVERNVLTIKASRPGLDDAKRREAVVSERPAGRFSRQVFLGDTLDSDNIAAEYANGVLTLRIPIADHAKPRKIAVGDTGTARQIRP